MTLEQVLIFVRLDLFFWSDFKVSSWPSFKVFTLDGPRVKILLSAGSNVHDESGRRLPGVTAKRPQRAGRPRQPEASAFKSPQLAIAVPSYCTLALIRPDQVPFKLLNAPPTGR